MIRALVLSLFFGASVTAAHAGFFQACSPAGCSSVSTPDFVFVTPAPPIFGTTVETRRKDNGNRVTITTTYRNGVEWSKERAVVHANRDNGGGGKNKSRGR